MTYLAGGGRVYITGNACCRGSIALPAFIATARTALRVNADRMSDGALETLFQSCTEGGDSDRSHDLDIERFVLWLSDGDSAQASPRTKQAWELIGCTAVALPVRYTVCIRMTYLTKIGARTFLSGASQYISEYGFFAYSAHWGALRTIYVR
jgi:hypothetical protein